LGHVPWVPGTFGTLAGIPVYLILSRLPLWGYIIGVILLVLGGILLADLAQNIYGRLDDQRIVIDEVAGFAVTMTGTAPGLLSIVLGFGLFRLFDLLKPWPGRVIDRTWTSGAGVVLDDVAAGVYAAATLQAVLYFWPA